MVGQGPLGPCGEDAEGFECGVVMEAEVVGDFAPDEEFVDELLGAGAGEGCGFAGDAEGRDVAVVQVRAHAGDAVDRGVVAFGGVGAEARGLEGVPAGVARDTAAFGVGNWRNGVIDGAGGRCGGDVSVGPIERSEGEWSGVEGCGGLNVGVGLVEAGVEVFGGVVAEREGAVVGLADTLHGDNAAGVDGDDGDGGSRGKGGGPLGEGRGGKVLDDDRGGLGEEFAEGRWRGGVGWEVEGVADVAGGEFRARVACALHDEGVVAVVVEAVVSGEALVDKDGEAELIGDEDGGVERGVLVAAGGVVHPVEDGGGRGIESGVRGGRVFQDAGAFEQVGRKAREEFGCM